MLPKNGKRRLNPTGTTNKTTTPRRPLAKTVLKKLNHKNSKIYRRISVTESGGYLSHFSYIFLLLICLFRINQSRCKQNGLNKKQSEAIKAFEVKCQGIKHAMCIGCGMVSLNIKVNGKGYCSTCCNRANKDYFQDCKLLPIWFKDGLPQYHLPEVLIRLLHAEKMLIQRVSPFVPLHHIKHGVFGLSGHVCAFEQDITGMSDILPRHGNDAGVIHVIQAMKAEIGDTKATANRAFLV